MNAAEFNARYPIGTLVFAYPGARREDIADATRLVTRTRTAAQASSSGDPVVWVEGEGAYIALTHVDPVSEDVWAEALAAEMSAGQASEFAATCPTNPPGHDWGNALTCRWCQATRTPAEAIVSGLASRRGGDETSAQKLVDAYRAQILAEAKVETVDWLVKKASEYYSTGSKQHALQAEVIGTLASKLDRGAVRAFIGTAHYRDAMDALTAEARASAFAETARFFDGLADAETDQHGYRARVMRGAANDVRRLDSGEAS
ncbi:hypothetical protein [Streptomyces sp. STCH 565 A]|uniref:hypothetical protein n=1 Tax=Streptomyces sp. STCH 565 A TaxID=2950532 RepID=UPI00207571C0|nr:hypothetical protein [Streptomyces sp. STCH 565 A]MCM8555676.1 hypothetical protein [Streptomyces sp. STCH 565 A]